MQEITPGYYYFRATGIDSAGEMQVVTSFTKYAANYTQLREQQKDFIIFCKEERSIAEPKLTHTVSDLNYKPHDYDFMCLVDINSDF